MVRLHRSARHGAALVVSLVALLGLCVLSLGAGAPPAEGDDGIVAASATVGLACPDGATVAMAVAAHAEPAAVLDGGVVTVSWALRLPGDALVPATAARVSIPLPGEAVGVDGADVVAGPGVAAGTVAVDDDRLLVDLGLVVEADDAAEVAATVMAPLRLRAGLAPADVTVAAPDALTLTGDDGTTRACTAVEPVSALLAVAVVPATTTTSTPPTTGPPPTTEPPPTTSTTVRDPGPGAYPAAGPASTGGPGALDVGSARTELAATRADLAEAASRAEALGHRAAAIDRRLQGLAVERQQLEAKLRERADALDAVLAAAYVAAVDAEVTPEIPAVGSVPLAAALDHAREDYVHALRREAELLGRLGDVATRRLDGSVALAGARADARALRTEAADGRAELDSLRLGRELLAAGFRFPVAGPHDFSDTWHAPRSGGRLHQGTDIFADEGTPLEAVEPGVLVDVGPDRLGGTTLWLVGESGTQYYYAHLSAYAAGVADGLVVQAGEVIGFVGHTGNARSTPSHLHFEVHPDGGAAVDAFPLLVAVDQAP